jgi:hypothetical protein
MQLQFAIAIIVAAATAGEVSIGVAVLQIAKYLRLS